MVWKVGYGLTARIFMKCGVNNYDRTKIRRISAPMKLIIAPPTVQDLFDDLDNEMHVIGIEPIGIEEMHRFDVHIAIYCRTR
jgi:hypothetical protein